MRKLRANKTKSKWLLKFGLGISLYSQLTTPGYSNVVGSDTQNFNPTTSGLDFVTVHSSETLEPGYFNLGLYINYAVNTLPFFEGGNQARTNYSDSLLGADINLGIGLLPGWDIGISVPQILNQEVETDGYRCQFSDNGNTEIRINSKLRLFGDRSGGFAIMGSANLNRIENNPFLGKDAGPTYNLEVAADTTISAVALGVNAGYRWRSPGEKIEVDAPIEPLGNQIIGSVAASYLFSGIDTKLIGEIFGSRPAKEESENSDRLSSSAEALLGLKYSASNQVALHLGAGTELINGRGSPDWRVYAGLNWSTGPKPRPRRAKSTAKAKEDLNPFKGPPKRQEKIIIHDILFEFDSAKIAVGPVNKTLKQLVEHLNKKPGFTKLIIEGHTDSIGTREYNKDLSFRRAKTIRSWLIQRFGVNPNKVSAAGKGEDLPIADNGNFQGRQLNRRVEFAIFRDM